MRNLQIPGSASSRQAEDSVETGSSKVLTVRCPIAPDIAREDTNSAMHACCEVIQDRRSALQMSACCEETQAQRRTIVNNFLIK